MVIGLTGRVGSGKTTAQNILLDKYDFFLADLDIIGHNLLKEESVKLALIGSFGRNILDENNAIDRKILGSIVFSDHEKLLTLNKIIHPEIQNKVKEIIRLNPQKNILISGALLEEIQLLELCDDVIVIDAEDDAILKQVGEKFTTVSKYQKSRGWYLGLTNNVVKNTFDATFKGNLFLVFENIDL